jgi:hypothetical protein
MNRTSLSRPLALALADRVLATGDSVFDYGCGRGGDIRILRKLGFPAAGWDPNHAPDSPKRPAAVVNLGYVINVIERPAERRTVVREAWALARRVLIVAARPSWESRGLGGRPHGDGVLTATNTFQKFYEQDELRVLLDSLIPARSLAAAPGIFYLFRSHEDLEALLARRARQGSEGSLRVSDLLYDLHREPLDALGRFVDEMGRLPAAGELPRAVESTLVRELGSLRASFILLRRAKVGGRWSNVDFGRPDQRERRYERHRELLDPLIAFIEERGRLPRPGELVNAEAIVEEFKSLRAAFSIIRRATGPERWQLVEQRARRNTLVYMALSAFGGRPRFSDLPEDLQHDVRDLFGTYKNVTSEADRLLFSAGDQNAVDAAARAATAGKLTPEALYVHISAVDSLPPLLRVYEGCGQTLAGTIGDATVIKLHRQKAQVSYLSYPGFDRDPHPVLHTVIVARLGSLGLTFRDFRDSENPPILHRKEALVPPAYPGRAKFSALTRQEERAGLLDDASIGTARGWARHLANHGVRLQGHRLVRAR